jgi:hypothetical protein
MSGAAGVGGMTGVDVSKTLAGGEGCIDLMLAVSV